MEAQPSALRVAAQYPPAQYPPAQFRGNLNYPDPYAGHYPQPHNPAVDYSRVRPLHVAPEPASMRFDSEEEDHEIPIEQLSRMFHSAQPSPYDSFGGGAVRPAQSTHTAYGGYSRGGMP